MTLAATSLTKDLKPPPMGEALAGAGASSGHTGRSGSAVSAAAAAGVDGLAVDFLALRSSSLARAMRSSVRLFSAIISRTFSSDSSLRDLYPRNQVCIRLAASSSDSSSASRRSSRRSGRLSPTFGSSAASSSSESVRSSPRDAASSAASALDTMGEPLRLRLALFPLCDGGEGWVSASSRLAALG